MRDKFTAKRAVPVDDIKLDIRNFRYYGEISSQIECIEAMLNDKRSNIFALAKDISEYGLTPDPIVLSKDENGDWVVREGNRRITALKILGNLRIVKNENLRSKFLSLVKKYKDDIPETVDCIACNDENTILEYLDRLHTGFRDGTGRITWTSENTTHYDMHRGRPGANALAIKVRDWVSKEGAVLKEPYNITNLQRVLQNKGVQSKLNYSWDGKEITSSVEPTTFLILMKAIAEKVGTVKVDDIYVKEKQHGFVDTVLKEHGIKINDAKTEPYILDLEKPGKKKKSAGGGTLPIKLSWDRKRLIDPKKTRVSIKDTAENVKARNVVTELTRKIDVRQATNAAAVLLRVLLEMSVERYMSINTIKIKDKSSLAAKIRSVVNHMKREGEITKAEMDETIKICDNQNLFSARTLQQFVHSFDFNPDRQVLCTLWDNIDKFVSVCWK